VAPNVHDFRNTERQRSRSSLSTAGIAFGAAGFAGYGLATSSWMMLAWLGTFLFAAIVMPTTNALMSHRISRDAQGELQGAAASLFSLSAILGPPLMTQLFARFTAPDSAVHLPGAAFLAASLLSVASLAVFVVSTRKSVSESESSTVPPGLTAA
jgi:MFS transporter, DHA1 family, tetracycline resistance protein